VNQRDCVEPSCGGTILADGYCDTCGAKGRTAPAPVRETAAVASRATPAAPRATPAAAASTAAPPRPPALSSPAPKPAPKPAPRPASTIDPALAGLVGLPCPEARCAGRIAPDGYCDTCGTKITARKEPPKAPPAPPVVPPVDSRPEPSLVTGSARGSRRTHRQSARTTGGRSRIGAGLIDVPPAPEVDPTGVVADDPEVPEDKRFCWNCGSPVGRGRSGRPGRLAGFCAKCRQHYDFVPQLRPGDRVGGQYEAVGCLAYGGLGWIYLAKDTAVNDRWVVLKGLLNQGDEAAMAAAVAERRFLAEVQHPNIVEIYNIVTHEGLGYTVMEYVGGPSLKQVLKQRREANGGKADPLPLEEAIAYILAILPAFSYLHSRALVYCDFKPDNIIQVSDDVKLIDLGGVRHLDDPTGDIYGTVGFQAPEIADMGPSISSDLYTIGRTLAVLTLDFRGYQTTYEHSLPDAADHPVLAEFDSFHRLLLKATAPHPDDRFQSAPELADQLLGVLREVVARRTGEPQPGPSNLFGGVPTESGLPTLLVDPADPAAGFLANLPVEDPIEAMEAIRQALAARQVDDSVEVRLRRARVYLDLGQPRQAAAEVARIEADDPWEWRAVWLAGVAALGLGDAAVAKKAFDRCLSELPGELAPKLAAAITYERAGRHAAAAWMYDIVSRVDPTYGGAAVGLARCRLATGDMAGALEAYGRVPRTHRAYDAAQMAAARTLINTHQFAEAVRRLERLQLDDHDRAQLEVELIDAALTGLRSGKVKADPKQRVNGLPLLERPLRRGLEAAYRRLASLTPRDVDRFRLVDRANDVRPWSVF
jgi:serine/threonine-protein kinase PknG